MTTQDTTPSTKSDQKILDFTAFKKKQDVNQEFARTRKPLYVNPANGRASGSPDGVKNQTQMSAGDDFGDRLQKIRSSLDRINSLMADLKKLSSSREQEPRH